MQIKTAEKSKNEDMLITSKNNLNIHQFNADLGYSSKAHDAEELMRLLVYLNT